MAETIETSNAEACRERAHDGLDIPIADCRFSTRVLNSLPSDVRTTAELWKLLVRDRHALVRVPGFGQKCCNEVSEVLAALGFPRLNTPFKEYVALKRYPTVRRDRSQRCEARRVLIEEAERQLRQAASDHDLAEARGMLSIALVAAPYDEELLLAQWQKGRRAAQERFAVVLDAVRKDGE